MEWNPRLAALRAALLLAFAGFAAANCGCITKMVSAMLYRGRIAPAACEQLAGKRVAVVCTSDSSDFGPNRNPELIAREVGNLLSENVEEIDVVDHQRVAAWLDEHDPDFVDYAEIGRGVKADMVVVIEIEALRLQDNATLFKGRADYRLEVIDVHDNGRAVYSPFTPPVIFPKIAGYPTTSCNREQFRQKFTKVIAGDIGRHFYAHDLNEQIASDPTDLDHIE